MQDAQHREAMGSLCTADRTSLISEIHQLRGQLEQIHQGEPDFFFKNPLKLALSLLVIFSNILYFPANVHYYYHYAVS